MTYIESPTQTLERFANSPGWLSSPIETIANDLKSSGNESRHEWDAFYYEERDGKLFDPIRKKNIVGTDGGDLAQKKVNQELEDWFISHDSGIALRVSPSGGMYNYPDEQVEIYRITYDFPSLQKRLFCSFRQFPGNLDNPEDIRQQIFPEEDSEEAIFEMISWVEKKSRSKVEANINNAKLRSDQAYYYATLLKSGEDPRYVFENMTKSGFLGENAIGCGGNSSLSSSLLTTEFINTPYFDTVDTLSNWHEGTCRVCGAATWVGPCSICKPCESKL